jgi:hypothetical protein
VGEDRTETGRRYTVPEAAEILGLTVEAVRGRIKRKKLRSTKEDSTVYVYLDTDQIPTSPTGHRPDTDQTAQPQPEMSALISEMRARVEDLREQLQSERQAHAEARRIIAGLVERIPAIEAPQEPSEPPSEATPQPGRVEPQPAVEGTQEAQESHEMHMPEAGGGPLPRDQQTPSERPWWRRMFGG